MAYNRPVEGLGTSELVGISTGQPGSTAPARRKQTHEAGTPLLAEGACSGAACTKAGACSKAASAVPVFSSSVHTSVIGGVNTWTMCNIGGFSILIQSFTLQNYEPRHKRSLKSPENPTTLVRVDGIAIDQGKELGGAHGCQRCAAAIMPPSSASPAPPAWALLNMDWLSSLMATVVSRHFPRNTRPNEPCPCMPMAYSGSWHTKAIQNGTSPANLQRSVLGRQQVLEMVWRGHPQLQDTWMRVASAQQHNQPKHASHLADDAAELEV